MTLFESLVNTPSDINEHLEYLRDLSSECISVCEMGVRYIVSTWAFVEGLPSGAMLVSVDNKHPSEYGANINAVYTACQEKGIGFEFIHASTLDCEIPEVDMIFIDTLHTGEQLSQELARHADKAGKYIVFHDTVSCADELMPVIDQFLKDNKKTWVLDNHRENNNGVLTIKRK